MPSAANLEPDGRFMALFVGAKHSGKTTAACSFLEEPPSRGFVFDFDGRIRGLLGSPWIDRTRIDYEYYPPRVGKNQGTMYERLNKDAENMLVRSNLNQNPYGLIVADSLTAECFGLMCDAVPLTHSRTDERGKTSEKGKKIGPMQMPGPEDYGFEANGTYQFLSFLRSMPVKNVIMTAHLVDRFGKSDPNDPFSETIVVGEKLSIRDKIGTNIGIYFDHIFRFERRMAGNQERFFVRFKSNIACTSFPGLPDEEIDITGQSFKDVLMEFVNRKNG